MVDQQVRICHSMSILYLILSFFTSGGGKVGAITIDNDNEFKVAQQTILLKSKGSCQVNIEFNIEDMHKYRITLKWVGAVM